MTININRFSLQESSNEVFAPLTGQGILPRFAQAASSPIQDRGLGMDAGVGFGPTNSQ